MTNLSIFNKSIRVQDELYSLNDLHKASGSLNKHRPKYWLANEQTKELIDEIAKDGIPPLSVKHGGSNSGTWVCKELVYAYAMWISAKFHLQVIRAFDQLHSQPKQQTLPLSSQSVPANPIDSLNFKRQRFIVTVDKGQIVNKQMLSDDDVIVNRNNLEYYLRDPEIFSIEQLIKSAGTFHLRVDQFTQSKLMR